MDSLINKDKFTERETEPKNSSLKEINLLIDLAKDVQYNIICINDQRAKYSGRMVLFALFLYFLLVIAIVNPPFFENIEMVIMPVGLMLIYFFVKSLKLFRKDAGILTIEEKNLVELIDMINSLVENLDTENEGIISVALVKMKLRRLSLSGKGPISMREDVSI